MSDLDIIADHPKWSREGWRYDVANGDTVLGYAEWVAHNVESNGESDKQKMVALLRRFLEEGAYDGDGEYYFASDADDIDGAAVPPGSKVPQLVVDVHILLDEMGELA